MLRNMQASAWRNYNQSLVVLPEPKLSISVSPAYVEKNSSDRGGPSRAAPTLPRPTRLPVGDLSAHQVPGVCLGSPSLCCPLETPSWQ